MPSEKVNTDEIIYATGNKGRYQIIQGFLCTFSCLTCAFPALSFVFLGYIPDHYCSALPNTTDWSAWNIESEFIEDIQYKQCHIDITSNKSGVLSHLQLSCINGYEYNLHRDVSIVSEFDLVCDKAGIAELSQTMLLLGQCFGAFCFSSLADRFGRKPPLIFSYFLLLLCTIAQAFINNVETFTALRFFMGASQQGIAIGSYSTFVELMTPEIRIYCGFIDSISWSLSTMSLAPVAYLTRNYSWRTFQLASLISFLHLPVLLWKGRREVTMFFAFVTGIFLLISFIFLATLGGTSIGDILSNLFSLLGKFCVSGSFMVIYIYTPEIYPTNLRNAGLGMASAISRLGGMVAPYSSLLSAVAVWGPGVVFTVCCILASILMYFLPETKGRPLPTTLQEMRDLKHEHRKSIEIIIPEVKK
ncbi:hypothetical protein LOTGIDRAFT_165906 [Lottia gigantea]|uniref:Major facilitator superfamily (MFS) profile domain-containing protein n=1 Tax=Lottia gigantea TaxID=225164 RepID=V3ZAZ2_LOTGI|nr:hypothetical protein LOTGIDRAFT_165906 [Lottia gigantea]ESO88163.1 hypothetical protein LOTGIDRAFT_165906 [Lottia gigantea]